jgi:cyclase
MLAKRVIPTMLCRGRTLVKGERFDGWRSIGHVAQAARVHARRGVDELLILDIAATAEGRGPDLSLVRELSEGCFIPITVGGGVRSLQDIDALLRAGADKVAICTGLFEKKDLLREASERFGAQAIVACMEMRGLTITYRSGRCTARQNAHDPVLTAAMRSVFAGEILLQSVERDGTMAGYDLELIREISQAVSVPVIASGGCSGYEDMHAAFQAGADACAAGALFAFTDATPRGAAKFLHNHGVVMRCV